MSDRRYYTEGSSARKLETGTVTRQGGRGRETASGRHRMQTEYTQGSAVPARRTRSEAVPVRKSHGQAAPAKRPKTDVSPARHVRPERKGKPSHLTDAERRAQAARKAENRAVTNAQIRYTTGMVVAVVIAVALCCYLLKLTSDVKLQKKQVASLKSQVEEQLDTNAGYSSGLDSMTDLTEIYNVATTKLGMVYSQPGQTIYYTPNNSDYVVQYKDVPGAD